ncbi:MAG: triose-phosphate isomerase [Candidatus Gastranaerophilales bacterium]|nr:triose-phosphate isomerase [Candidatus Gastranaerophilales bacterium]
MSRKPIIAGNWKMNNNSQKSVELIKGLKSGLDDINASLLPEVVVAPVFTSLYAVNEELNKCAYSKIALAAQNCYYQDHGAYTGEISIDMLKDFNMTYIIIGHSERRQYFGETDEMINQKAKAILANGLLPIICCGETLEQREQGITDKHISNQIMQALEGISSEDTAKSVIAYEPIWAIGTGKTCDADEANRVIKMIRETVKNLKGENAANSIRILYGGSVKPETIEEQMAKSDIDGALVGGASLKADSFAKIVKGAMAKASV